MATKYFDHGNEETDQMQQHDHASGPFAAIRAFAARHPLALFLTLAFGLAYPIMAVAILVQRGVLPGASLPARLGISLEEAASAAMLLLGLLPAALIATALDGGRPAVRALLRRVARWRIGLVWGLVVIVAMSATTIAVAVFLGDTIRWPGAGVLAREFVAIAVAFFVINLWEETTWAGFLQTRLERHRNLFVAALLTGLAFGAIHLPVRLISGEAMFAPASLAVTSVTLAIFGCLFRPLIGLVLRGTGDSILAVGLLHTFFNRSNNVDGLAADLLVGTHRSGAALLAWLLLTVVVAVAIRCRLGRAYRRELEARTGEPMGAHETTSVMS